MIDSKKTISMPLSEYESDLEKASNAGYGQALKIVKHVLEGKIVKFNEHTSKDEKEVWSSLMERLGTKPNA